MSVSPGRSSTVEPASASDTVTEVPPGRGVGVGRGVADGRCVAPGVADGRGVIAGDGVTAGGADPRVAVCVGTGKEDGPGVGVDATARVGAAAIEDGVGPGGLVRPDPPHAVTRRAIARIAAVTGMVGAPAIPAPPPLDGRIVFPGTRPGCAGAT